MKTLKFEFTGDSKLVYLYLFKVDVVEKLKELEEGEYDFIDFWMEHASKDIIIGNGLDIDGNLDAYVYLDDELLYSDGIHSMDTHVTDLDELEAEFQEEVCDPDLNYLNALTTNIADPREKIDGDGYFLKDESDYLYAAIETVECDGATGTARIEVADDFYLSDIRPVFVDIDSGDPDSLMREIYRHTGLERQLIELLYGGKSHEIDSGDNEGGWSELSFYRRNDDGWEYCSEVHDLINQL